MKSHCEPPGFLLPLRLCWQRYAVAAAAVLAAAAVRFAFMEELENRAAYVTFFPAVLLASLYGGLGPGLLATLASGVLAAYYWVDPSGYFWIEQQADWMGLAAFFIGSTMISGMTTAVYRAHVRALAAEEEARCSRERLRSVMELREARPLRMIGTVLDITEWKKANEALKKAHDELERRVRERTEALQRSHSTLRVLKECDEALVRANDEMELLRRICSILVTLGGAKMAWVGYARENAAKTVEPVAFMGEHAKEYLKTARITWADKSRGRGPTGTAIRTRKVCLASDLDPARMKPWAERQRLYGFDASMALPLVWENQCLGALMIYLSEMEAFTAEEIELFKRLAGDLSYGIVALRTRSEHLQLQRELVTISEREKQVISQELHDGLCQNLAGTAMMGYVLQRRLMERGDPDAEYAGEVFRMLNVAVNEARNISHGLHPVSADPSGLMEALAQLAPTISTIFRVQCVFECPQPVFIPNEVASTHLFRIAQEAIGNARKHGEAEKIVVTLREDDGEVSLSIEDDGAGISEPPPQKRGLGLNTMSHRANQIGGTLTVRRIGRQGTIVCCKAPKDSLKPRRKPQT